MHTTTRHRRGETGRVSPTVVGAVALVALVVSVGVWTTTRADDSPATSPGTSSAGPSSSPTGGSATPDDDPTGEQECTPSAEQPGPEVDLGVQASRGNQQPRNLTLAQVRDLVAKAEDAGATIISTAASFRALKPTADSPYRFDNLDKVVDAASEAGLTVKLRMTGSPAWALDEPPVGPRQAPRSDAELERWAGFVRDVMEHVDGKVGYVEVWTEPNAQRYWATGPDPVEYARLLDVSARAIREVAPDTTVVAGGLRGNAVGYLEQLYDAFETIGLSESPFDMVGVEPFNGGAAPGDYDPGQVYVDDPFGEVDGNFLGFEALREVMTDRGDEDKSVYITLFGYSTSGEPGDSGDPDNVAIDDVTRAGYLTSALGLATCRPYVAALSWYAFHPNPWDPPSWTLLDPEGGATATYDALVAWGEAA